MDGSVTVRRRRALGLMQSISGSTVDNFSRTPAGDAVGRVPGIDHSHSYYVQDHLGSVVGLFDSAGSFKGGYSYSPYGEARSTSTNAAVTANPLRYVGEHHDGNGIYKLGARYYDTSLGRFTQTDPSGQEANPYAYAARNPVSNADPSGLFTEGVTGAIPQWYGFRVWISRDTLRSILGGIGVAGAWIPEPTVSKIVASIGGLGAAFAPGGIEFSWTPIGAPGYGTFFDVSWQ